MMHKEEMEIGGLTIEIVRKINLKNLYIRVNPPEGDVTVSSPMELKDEDTSADLNYSNSNCRANKEQNDPTARPAISSRFENLEDYDVIFIGYPIWWDLAPRVVNTFIESHQLNGKTIIPFATSGGSTITGSVSQLKKAYPKLHWQTGKLLNRANDQDLKAWLHTVLD